MITALLLAAMVAVAWLTVRSMNREKRKRDRAAAIRTQQQERHGVDDLFVSREDGSFVGLSADGDRVLLGKGDDGQVFPAASIRAVEGLRDGIVLIRAEPDGDPVTPAPIAEQSVVDVPERILSMGLRVTLADQAFTVLFYEGGRHGVDPANEEFRKQAARTEAWFRKLSSAMRLAR